MSTEIKLYYAAIVVIFGLGAWMAIEGRAQQEERRTQATAFYHLHHCRPLGYVATKHDPIRTYQCDNGVFIWDHMK